MNDDFIIDENILFNARRGIDENGKRTLDERIFMYNFFQSDKKLPHTPNIRNQYYRIGQTEVEDETYQDAGLMKWFYQRLVDGNLCPVIEGLSIPKYRFIKPGDDEFVYLAIVREGNLVTADRSLEDEIKKEGLKVKYVFAKDAISLV